MDIWLPKGTKVFHPIECLEIDPPFTKQHVNYWAGYYGPGVAYVFDPKAGPRSEIVQLRYPTLDEASAMERKKARQIALNGISNWQGYWDGRCSNLDLLLAYCRPVAGFTIKQLHDAQRS
jgi:hypothetical protein